MSEDTAADKLDPKETELFKILRYTSEWIPKVYLVSAFDFHRGHLPSPRDLPAIPELIVLDSGGYEIGSSPDFDPQPIPTESASDWSQEDLVEVWKQWPDEYPAICVSYDHPEKRVPYEEQLIDARALFRNIPNQLHCLLLKPETKTQATLTNVLGKVMGDPSELSAFDVIGVTEKELGSSYLDRMKGIARLREALDQAGLKIPIHVFGSLDPVAICLYFFSGADIFDGLTWLRYGYRQAECLYKPTYWALEFPVSMTHNRANRRTAECNLYFLYDLTEKLRAAAFSEDLTALPACDIIETAIARLDQSLSAKDGNNG